MTTNRYSVAAHCVRRSTNRVIVYAVGNGWSRQVRDKARFAIGARWWQTGGRTGEQNELQLILLTW